VVKPAPVCLGGQAPVPVRAQWSPADARAVKAGSGRPHLSIASRARDACPSAWNNPGYARVLHLTIWRSFRPGCLGRPGWFFSTPNPVVDRRRDEPRRVFAMLVTVRSAIRERRKTVLAHRPPGGRRKAAGSFGLSVVQPTPSRAPCEPPGAPRGSIAAAAGLASWRRHSRRHAGRQLPPNSVAQDRMRQDVAPDRCSKAAEILTERDKPGEGGMA
jgi:hypothetical protein